MKKILILVSLFTALFATAQPQDTLYVWKAGQLVIKQSIKTVDMDSITFKRPTPIITPNQVIICSQVWATKNLNVTTYSDGAPIPQVTSPIDWQNLSTGAWCYYNNDPASEAVYGKLYNWYAAAGIYDAASAANPALRKKLAPVGWHVPTDSELSTLINCLDPDADGGNTFPNTAGGKMKSTGTLQAGNGLWQTPNTDATNESGFTAFPGGIRTNGGTFDGLSLGGCWWSSSENGPTTAWVRLLGYGYGTASRGGNENKKYGYSVRCVRD